MEMKVKPQPQIDVWNTPFWEACRRHELSMQACAACQNVWFPPGPRCPACGSDTYTWIVLSGRGTVLSWAVFHQNYFAGFGSEMPYNVAMVGLHEGPVIISNLTLPDHEDIAAGMRVEVVFDDREDGWSVPKFAPLDATDPQVP